MTKRKLTNVVAPSAFALKGFLFAFPFFILNLIVVLRVEPWYSWLGTFSWVRKTPLFPLLLLLLFPVGAWIATRPMLEQKKLYVLNTLVVVLLLGFFLMVFPALSIELYRCDVLKIPNCD